MINILNDIYTILSHKYRARRSDEKRVALAKSAALLTKSEALWGLNGVSQYTSAPIK